MNKESQRRNILRFLKGKAQKEIDVFCAYQWIDRCHYEGWWDLALALAPSIPPNSLEQQYHKRLDYLIAECRDKLEALKHDFIELKNPHASNGFLVPKSFWSTCTDLGIKLAGRSSRGLRLEFIRKKFLLIENIDLNGCVFHFYDRDSDKLNSWLSSHGFDYLTKGIIWPRKSPQTDKSRLKLSWQDATNLIPSIVEDLKTDDEVLLRAILIALYEEGTESWDMILNYLEKKYSIDVCNENLEKLRKLLIHYYNEKGYEHLVKRLA